MFHDMFVSVCSVLTSNGRQSGGSRRPRRFNPGLGFDGLERRVVLSSVGVDGVVCCETSSMVSGPDVMMSPGLSMVPGTIVTVVSSEDSGPMSEDDPATDGGDVMSGEPSGPTDTQVADESGEPVGSFPVSESPDMVA